jgi:hypothetical protein
MKSPDFKSFDAATNPIESRRNLGQNGSLVPVWSG